MRHSPGRRRGVSLFTAKRGFLTEEPSSNREVERLVDTLIDGIKALIDGDELVAEFSIHSPYLAAVLVNAFAKISLNTVDAFAKISLDTINTSSEVLFNAVDTSGQALLNTIDTPSKTVLDTVNLPSEAAFNAVNTDIRVIDALGKLRLPVRTSLAKTALTARNAAMVGMLLMSVFMAGFLWYASKHR